MLAIGCGISIGLRTIRWHCWSCKTLLKSESPWWYGFCGKKNSSNSLLSNCVYCAKQPPSYECPNCRSCTYFEPGFYKTNAARPKPFVHVTPPSSDSPDSTTSSMSPTSVTTNSAVSMNSHDSAQTDDAILDIGTTLRDDLRTRRFF